jgi:glucose/arabinose dehydrogenase
MGLKLRLLFCLSLGWSSFGCAPPQREKQAEGGAELEIVAQNLQVPWDLAFAGGNLYFTERSGKLSVLRQGEKKPRFLLKLIGILTGGKGGSMGLAFHPRFETNGYLYISYIYESESRGLKNRIVRYTLDGERSMEPKVICDNLPGGWVHNGCRLRFGPDAKLYATTGDAGQKEIAQQLTSLGGKLLRMNDDGSVPAANPFPDSFVYSYGPRNGQRLDWHLVTRELYEAEHGPWAGTRSTLLRVGST